MVLEHSDGVHRQIPDVSVDKSSIRQLWGDSGVGKEQFYELNADVHIADPNFLLNRGQSFGERRGPSSVASNAQRLSMVTWSESARG